MHAKDRHDDLDALDRLVDAELSALIAGLQRHRRDRRTERPVEPAAADPAPRRGPGKSNVIRAHPLARHRGAERPVPMAGLFSEDETAFLANAVDWLRGRPNADILLDALGRQVLDFPVSDRGSDEASVTAPDRAAEPVIAPASADFAALRPSAGDAGDAEDGASGGGEDGPAPGVDGAAGGDAGVSDGGDAGGCSGEGAGGGTDEGGAAGPDDISDGRRAP